MTVTVTVKVSAGHREAETTVVFEVGDDQPRAIMPGGGERD